MKKQMTYTKIIDTPLGKALISADETGLTGFWFEKQRYYGKTCEDDVVEYKEAHMDNQASAYLNEAENWLDLYFKGIDPGPIPKLHMIGSAFQLRVWEILLTIPWGKTMSYGEIAKQIAAERGIKRMSAQAVGGAVGRNPISVIVPCHRVIGSDGSLTGYGGGLDKKIALLNLEGLYVE